MNDGVHDTVSNATIESLVTSYGVTLNIIVKLPENSKDFNYQRILIRNTVNLDKFVKGNRGNFLTAILMEQVMKFFDFEIKFPFPKVSSRCFIFQLLVP